MRRPERLPRRLHARCCAIALAAACGAAPAQTPPTAPPPDTIRTPPAGALPTTEQLRPREALPRDAGAPPPAAPVPRELGKPNDDITLDVVRYAVADDAPAELRAALPTLTAAYTGRQRSYEDLVNAAAAVTRFLQRELGYYLGYAFLPEQTPEGGIVRIAVLEGRLDEVVLQWPDGMPVDRGVVEAYLARLRPGEILRVRDVERVVFLVNDLRGLTARFEVRAGRKPGTASLVVSAQPEQRVVSRAEFDSFGSRYSGPLRAGWLSTISSPLGRGDGLVLNALSTTTGGLMFALAGYTLPVGADGLKLGSSVSYVRYDLDADLLPLGLNGDASTLTLYGLYPAVRSRNLNLFTLLSLDLKRFTDRVRAGAANGVDKRVDELQLSLSGDARDDLLSGGVNTFEASLIGGRLSVPNRPGDVPPSYALLRLNASRLQNIVDNRLLAYVSLKAQLANANLDTTAQFQLGGPDRVRAFAPGEGTGDAGVVLSVEARLLPPEAWFGRLARELVFSAYVDAGSVQRRHDPGNDTTLDNRNSLSGWGIGAVWDRPRDFAVRAYASWPISGTPVNDERLRKPRLYVTANKTF